MSRGFAKQVCCFATWVHTTAQKKQQKQLRVVLLPSAVSCQQSALF